MENNKDNDCEYYINEYKKCAWPSFDKKLHLECFDHFYKARKCIKYYYEPNPKREVGDHYFKKYYAGSGD